MIMQDPIGQGKSSDVTLNEAGPCIGRCKGWHLAVWGHVNLHISVRHPTHPSLSSSGAPDGDEKALGCQARR